MTINTDSIFERSGRIGTSSDDIEKKFKRSEDIAFPVSATEEVYHVAWALVLARHGGIEEVEYGYIDKNAGKDPVAIKLVFIAGIKCGSILQQMKERLCNLSNLETQESRGARTCKFQSVLSLTLNNQDSPVDTDPEHFSQPLILSCKSANQTTSIRAWYYEESFGCSEVKILLSHFQEAVVQLKNLPASTNIGDISIFGPIDHEKVFSWNRHAPKAFNQTLTALFEHQARLRPSATAVCSWDSTLTYAELDDASYRLSGKLIEIFGDLRLTVPLCFEKSALAIISMLAVLRAGGSFVHLGISNPTGRKRAIADACKAKIILCSAAYKSAVEALDRDILVIDQKLVENSPLPPLPLPPIQATDIALVVFTSGSTGTPKGIVLEHGSLATTCEAIGSKTKLGPQSKVMQFSAYTFDASFGDIFFSLARGACICSPSEQERLDSLAMAARRLKVNWAFMTPSVLSLLQPHDIPSLQTILLGGEKFTQKLVADWAENVSLHIVMGPSECAVFCAGSDAVRPNHDPSNFGHAAGCRAWVVESDDYTKLAPLDCVGELLIEGRIVAREYLNDPQRTLASFLQGTPWVPVEDENRIPRLYKTGDLVRLNSRDGTFSFVGRKDNQFKLHGQRIEFGEIEHNIQKTLPDMTRVLPLMRNTEQNGGRHSLVVFLVFERGSPMVYNKNTTVQNLTEFGSNILRVTQKKLAETLPTYMIPTLFIPINEAPLNASGKTDATYLRQLVDNLSQKQLLEFAMSQTTTTTKKLTSAETALRSLWAKVLQMEESLIGSDSEFLRLGGDSLAAMNLVLEAAEVGIHLTAPDVLKSARLSTMALSVSTFQGQFQDEKIIPFALLPTRMKLASLKASCALTCGVNSSQIEDIYPCTPVQEMLFASSLKHPGSYVTRLSCRLPSFTLLSAWKLAWDKVLNTVDVLRTRIVSNSSSGLLQVVIDSAIDWKFHDSLEDYWARDAQTPMKSGDPLVRFGIIQKSLSDQPIFALTCHHTLYDAFTLNMIFEQVTKVHKSQPSENLTSFKNYVSYIKDLPLKRSYEFWNHKLEGSSTTLWPAKPSLEARPAILQGYASMPALRTSSFTVAMFAQTAYALLLSAYSGSQDLVFGLVGSGRHTPLRSIMKIAGPTLYTVPFRSIIKPDEKIGELMSRLRSDTFEVADHGHIGLQQIRQINPDSAQACDFRTLLVIQPQELIKHTEHFGTNLSIAESVATYGLTFECRLTEGGMEIFAEYDSVSLSEEQVGRFIRQFAYLVAKLATSSLESLVSDISFFSDGELKQIQLWNSQQDIEIQESIHEAIGLRMIEHPDAQAVCGWDGVLTYRDLDLLSARMVVRLRAIGVTFETVVPICSEKSIWVVVAMIAVLRAGGAFLLLDPSNPEDRLKDMLFQVEATQIIASPNFVDTWAPFIPEVIELSPAIRQWEDQREQGPWANSTPHDLAYIVFTSGSTGKPKGILVEHTNYLTSALARASRIYRTHESRVYQFSSYSFDTSIEDILTTLIVGGTICVPSEQERKSDLIASINRYAANAIDLTPSVANLISPSMVPLLKVLILGGEAMTGSHVEKWASSDCILINTYGPAECSIVATVAKPARVELLGNSVEIGKAPCGHTWVVDPLNHRKLIPIGAIGELLIEGPLVARGYLKDPSKTSEMFVTDLPWASPQTRFYKTGDLVKYQDDGNLTFIGRRDTQVKIYGQRVELGEIERRFLVAPGVSGCAVELFKFPNNRQRLVAFVCFGHNKISPCINLKMSSQFREQLAAIESELIKTLPQYMIPSVFIPLSAMPLAMTGKLDRKFLRQIVEDMSQNALLQYNLPKNAESGGALNTEAQHKLQKIWSKVLDKPQTDIGLNSNFFGIGGDSISAMQLSMSLSQQHSSNLSVADILRNPIFANMADLLEGNSSINKKSTLLDHGPFSLLQSSLSVTEILQQSNLPWSEDEIEDIYPCTPLQEGFMALGASQPEAYVARQVFRIPDHLDVEKFRKCWVQVMIRNAILRTRIIYLENHGSLQVIGKTVDNWAFASSLEGYINQDKSVGMTYNDSLCRFCIVRDDKLDQRYLVHTMHHALFDGVSLQILDQQVSHLYHSNSENLPQVPFTRFISYLQSIDSSASEVFWRNQLEGSPSTAFLAPTTDGIRRQEKITTSISFNRNSSGVLSMCTPASAVRAAWALVVSTYSESSDVLFGSTLSGRNVPVPGIMEMAAPTLTTLPIRVIIDKSQTLLEYVKQIQQQAIDMIPYEHYGLQNIRKVQTQATNFNHILILHSESSPDAKNSLIQAVDIDQLGLVTSSTKGYYTHSLVMDCTFSKDSLKLEVFYDSNIVKNQQMQRIVHNFEHILNQVTMGDLDLVLKDLVLCSPQDHQEILEWNQIEHREKEYLIHQLVKDTAILHSHSPALESWDGNLTYRELESQSSRLASFLWQRLDFREDLIIPICFDKSVFTVVSMLAVLKMGAAYVPLESSYPASRLQDIVGQVGAKMVLASAEYSSIFSDRVDHVIIVDTSLLDNICQAQKKNPEKKPLPTPTPVTKAMIIFTSGSTGKPKGVVITHGSFSTMALGLGSELRLGPQTRALQFAAYAFDVSNAEIFLTLIHGGCVCIPSHHDRMNNLAKVIVRMQINWLYLTPTGSSLVQGPEEVPCVKTLLLGGEAARKDIIDTWAPKVHLVNTYGPAEGSIWPSITTFTTESSPLDIGRGNDCYMWLVDPENHHRLMPIGAIGEIILEGPLLADGYFGDPEKTKQAFVHDLRWASNKGKTRRFYATGDLATYNADGTMSFAGRIGTMVKLRGQRLELGEVEARIKQFIPHEARTCVELMPIQGSGDRLVAFITTINGDQLPAEQWLVTSSSETRSAFSALHSSLTTILPSYMLPSLYIPLNTMPTTFSGKTDRKFLRSWYSNASKPELEKYLLWTDGKKAPRTVNESHIQGLWSRVLDKDRSIIGIDDNFFTVGGDSLAAIKLASMARNSGIVLSVADIFLSPKLADQAAKADVNVLQTRDYELSFSLLNQGDDSEKNLRNEGSAWGLDNIKDVYPCTPLQEGLMSLSVQQQGAYIMNHAFSLPPNLDIPRFQKAWSSAVIAFDILRTRIIPHASHGFLQIILQEDPPEWQLLDTLDRVLTDRNPELPYFGRGLIRYYLVDDSTRLGQSLFVLRIHHALFDAKSLQNIVDYVEKLYLDMPLPNVLPYGHFVQYTQQSKSLSSQAYWLNSLENFSGCIFPEGEAKLAADRSAASFSTSVTFDWDKSAKYTMATSLVGSWAVLLSSYTHSNDVLFGLTLSGRDAPFLGVESMTGPTLTTVPRRIRVRSTGTVSDFLAELQREGAELIEHQHYGLQNIMAIPELRSVCEFNNRLILETAPSGEGSRLMKDYPLHIPDNYFTDPLGIVCILEPSETSTVRLHITAMFDQFLISKWEIKHILSQFGHVIQQLSQPNKNLETITVCEDAAKYKQLASSSQKVLKDFLQCNAIDSSIRAQLAPEVHSSDGVTVWIGDVTNPKRLAPLSAIGELCVESPSIKVVNANHGLIPISIKSLERPQGELHSSFTYRTGHLVRYKSNKSLAYIGRNEEQIIIKGRRIGLREIEHHTRKAFGMKVLLVAESIKFSNSNASVLVVFFPIGDNENFEYAVEDNKELIQLRFGNKVRKAKEILKQSLPSFKLPQAYIPLKSMPVATTGEIDRRRLQDLGPKLDLDSINKLFESQDTNDMPSTEIEKTLQSLWSHILNLDISEISCNHSWIKLGGDSMSAVRLVAFSRAKGVEITVSNVLLSSNLSELAKSASFIREPPQNTTEFENQRIQRVQNAYDDEEFADSIRDQMKLSMLEVEDVALASDFQASMVVGGMLPERGWNNYMMFDFDRVSESQRLVEAWQTIAAHNPSLRTLFLIYKSKIFQIVACSISIETERIECQDIETVCKDWIREDMKNYPTLNKPILRGALFLEGPRRARFVIGISHALYDGTSLIRIRQDFLTAYYDKPLVSKPTFASFVEHVAKNRSHGISFWKKILIGSKMTEIVHHPRPLYKHPLTKTHSRTIAMPDVAVRGYTFTTLLKAAWTIVLAQWTNTADITFGHLVSGRSTSFSNVDEIVGPCLNIIPVRATLKSTSIFDLLQQIHSQYIEALPFETTGYSNIIAECTDWPKWTRFSSIIQHQNSDNIDSSMSPKWGDFKMKTFSPYLDYTDIWVITYPEGHNVRVDLDFSPEVIKSHVASKLLNRVCDLLEILSSHTQENLPEPSIDFQELPRLPLQYEIETPESLNVRTESQEHITIISDIWKSIGLSEVDIDIPFYDISGDLVPALQISTALMTRFGMQVDINRIVENATKRQQAQMIQDFSLTRSE